MSDSGPGPPSGSRRALLCRAGAAAAGAGALLTVGCGAGAVATTSQSTLPEPVRRRDIAILTAALELERRTVAAYVAGIPLLEHPQAKTARQFLSEELEHTGKLISLITSAGGTAPARPNTFQLGHPRNAHEVLILLHSLETMQITTYLRSIPRLSQGPVRATVATILNVDSQHVSLLSLIQGRTPVPAAFVTGAE